jgi:hypothetical protein
MITSRVSGGSVVSNEVKEPFLYFHHGIVKETSEQRIGRQGMRGLAVLDFLKAG